MADIDVAAAILTAAALAKMQVKEGSSVEQEAKLLFRRIRRTIQTTSEPSIEVLKKRQERIDKRRNEPVESTQIT